MPLTFVNIEVSGASYLGDPLVQSRVVTQSGSYTGLWFKIVSGTWQGFSTQPSGKVSLKDFTALVPSPAANTVYRPTFGGELITYNGTANAVEIYYDFTESKFKCGRPN